MPLYIDQLDRKVEIPESPRRIISLVPSQTELLFDLGLGEEVIGITKFCVHPDHWFKTKTRIGGTKLLHLEKIKDLQPDLIIANKEENEQSQIEELAKGFPVWVSDVNNLSDALDMIGSVGEIVNRQSKAKQITDQIEVGFNQLPAISHPPGACYLIWKDPYMTVGGDSFIHDMLQRAGFQNLFAHETRYPQITIEQLQSVNCRLLLLSSEPYPFKRQQAEELQSLFPGTSIILVDGEMFSWYGSRLLKAPAYFEQLRNQVLSLSHARRVE